MCGSIKIKKKSELDIPFTVLVLTFFIIFVQQASERFVYETSSIVISSTQEKKYRND